MFNRNRISQIALAAITFGALSVSAYAQPNVPRQANMDPQSWGTHATMNQPIQVGQDTDAEAVSANVREYPPRLAYLEPQAFVTHGDMNPSLPATQNDATFGEATFASTNVQMDLPQQAYQDPQSWVKRDGTN